MSITGEPGRPSVRIGPSAIDLITGAHAAFGIVLALRVRDRTGAGQHVETSLYDSSLHLISHYIADYTGLRAAARQARRQLRVPRPLRDVRRRATASSTSASAPTRCSRSSARRSARRELASDPRFATNAQRVAHRDELDDELAPLFAARDAAHVGRACASALGIPASLVNDIAEVVAQEQALAREMIVETGIDGVRTRRPADQARAARRRRSAAPPPSLGADNDALLGRRPRRRRPTAADAGRRRRRRRDRHGRLRPDGRGERRLDGRPRGRGGARGQRPRAPRDRRPARPHRLAARTRLRRDGDAARPGGRATRRRPGATAASARR